MLLCAAVLLGVPGADANVLIQRSITIDGDMSDWTGVSGDPNILTNPGQFSEDPEAVNCDPDNLQPGDDLDCETVSSTGRDLKKFAFTFDDGYLYMYVERFASTSNATSWLFYLDVDNDALMGTGDKVLEVRWKGSNRNTDISIHDYDPASQNGDDLVEYNEVVDTETADGYTMPGDLTNETDIETFSGGSDTGVEMETRISWDVLAGEQSEPFSVGFHISASRGTSNTTQIEDNMDGPGGAGGGNALIFADPFLTKAGPENDIGLSGQSIPFTLTLDNDGPNTATDIEVTDDCSANGFDSFHSADASLGSYDDTTGIWSIPSLDANAQATLTLRCLIEVQADTELTNSAAITAVGVADTNTDNNADSATVTVVPVPELTMMKFSTVTRDPVNGGSQPKRIPGAWVTYTVKVVNNGFGNAETLEITDILPDAVTLYTGDFAGAGDGPVIFTPGNSGLTYDNTTDLELLDGNDDPVAPSGDFDPSVERIRISPQGTFWGSAESPTNDSVHEVELQFRVRVD